MPDCNLELEREYWRVFAVSDASAYIIPRVDGAPTLAAACADPKHELHEMLQQYALCEPARASTIDRVNDLAPADALAIAHYLHANLWFEVVPGGITPYPIPTDIIDACELEPEESSGPFVALCERERERLDSGNDIGFSYEGPGAVELVKRLNQLYGTGTQSCEVGLRSAGTRRAELIDSVDRACEVDADCTLASVEVGCLTDCGGLFVATSAADGFATAIEELDDRVCRPFLEAGCKPPAPSSCPPGMQTHGCISGRCQ